MSKNFGPALFLLMLGVLALGVGCGKKAEESKSIDPITPPVFSDLDEYLEKQSVLCESGACPDYLAKVIVLEGNKKEPRICTGFLTDSETIATSSNCLSSILYQPDQDCSKDVFIYFPKTYRRFAQRVGCNKVIQVSEPNREDPVYTRSDLAFLSLDKSVKRSLLYFNNKDGLTDGSVLTRWSVEQTDQFTGVIRRDECRVIHNSYINPLANNPRSPNMIFGDCGIKNGNSGAPLVDNAGKVRALTSLAIRPKILQAIYDNYRKEPLKDMFYASNLYCSPSIYDADSGTDPECNKDLSYNAVANARGIITDSTNYYAEARKKIAEYVDSQNRYVKFDVSLITNPSTLNEEVAIRPLCFKNYQDWRSFEPKKGRAVFTVNIPQKSYRFTTDAYGRIVGQELTATEKLTEFEFNTRVLRYQHEDGSHKATLTMKNDINQDVIENFGLCN